MTTIARSELTDRLLVQSLGSKTCPVCGGIKKYKQTFCSKHYYALPHPMRRALYMGVGAGYRESVIEALTFLEKPEAILPE